MKFNFLSNISFYPKTESTVWPEKLIKSKYYLNFQTKLDYKNYALTKKNDYLIIQYKISSCLDYFLLSLIYSTEIKIKLKNRNSRCTIEPSWIVKLALNTIFIIGLILTPFILYKGSMEVFWSFLIFLIISLITFYGFLNLAVKFMHNIVKDDLTELICKSASKI